MEIIKKLKEKSLNSPDKVVIHTNNRKINFKQLDSITDSIANQIFSVFGDNKFVPVISKDDEDYIFVMLATWKVGKIYLPFNSDTPKKRIQNIMEKLNVNKILIRDSLSMGTDICEVKIDESFNKNQIFGEVSNDIAYILTTSGTTGEPKSVAVTHNNLNWFLKTLNKIVPFNKDDKFLVSTPPAFDVSFHENLSFIYGDGELVVVDGKSPVEKFKNLSSYLTNYSVTHLAMSPSSCNSLIKIIKDDFSNLHLKYLLLAGEELKVDLVNKVYNRLPNINLLNLYGPTETTIYATYNFVDKNLKGIKVPIGRPLENVDIKLFDDSGKETLDYGEIYIGGKGVSKGYYNDSILTNKKFIKINNMVYYKTGDYGYYDEDKETLIFDRRKDDQVKINGIRIEIGEIESVAEKIIGNDINIKVMLIEKKLVMFIETKFIELNRLKEKLLLLLPKYMVPNEYLLLEKFPLNQNRKLDSKYLIDQYKKTKNSKELKNNYFNQEDGIDLIIGEIQNITKNTFINRDTEIINLPGVDSLAQIEIIVSLEEIFNVKLEDDFLVSYPTPYLIYTYISKGNSSAKVNKLSSGNINLDSIMDNILANYYIFQNNKFVEKDTYYLQKSYIVDNFYQILQTKVKIPDNFGFNEIKKSIETLVKRHEILQTSLTYNSSNQLIFRKYDLKDWNYRLYNTSYEVSEDLVDSVKSLLKSQSIDGVLWYFLYSEYDNSLYLFINHLICDQSSLNILIKDYFSIIQNKKLSTLKTNYWDFISYNSSNVLDKEKYLQVVNDYGFDLVNKDSVLVVEEEEKAIKYIAIDSKNKNIIQCISDTNYLIAQALMKGQNKKVISGSTIVDIRTFDDLSIENVVGDVHTTLPVLSFQDEGVEQYSSRFQNILGLSKKGINVFNILYFNYPDIKDEYRDFEFFLDDNCKFSANYLGGIRKESIESTIQDLTKQREVLSNFSEKKLYITFFQTGDQTIIVPLSNSKLSKETLEDFGGTIYYE